MMRRMAHRVVGDCSTCGRPVTDVVLHERVADVVRPASPFRSTGDWYELLPCGHDPLPSPSPDGHWAFLLVDESNGLRTLYLGDDPRQ